MPRKVFVAGEILTAADVNTNLMDQSVMVFDDATARATAIPTPVEGMVTYLKDEDEVTVFDGSAFKAVGPGKILQVVSVTKTDTFSTASTTFQDITDMSVSITPSSATNKVMVFATFSASAGPGEGAAFVRVVRNGSAVNVGDASGTRIQVGAGTFGKNNEGETGLLSTLGQSITFLDAPETTSPVVYKLQLRERNGTVNAAVGRSGADDDTITFSRAPTNLTLMEVAG